TLAGYEELADLELIHDHTAIGPLIANRQRPGRPKPPVVVTFHGSFTPVAHRVVLASSEIASIVAISHSHARQAGQVPIAAVIHHGIDLGVYRPRPQHDGFLLFMGRMSPDKGCDIAIDVAHRAGTPLRIATKMRTADEKAYFEQQVEPVLAAEDVVLVEPDLDTRCELLSAALALLNPIVWSEPFGLVMAESLASGTPVIAVPNGAAPEIVDHGITGFLGRDRDEMVRAVGRAATIDPAVCRLAAENRFSLDRMAGDYERLFRRVLAGPDTVTPPRELDQRSAAPDGNHG
ncbi:MAG TPA: glycosyltransferase, partial [Propionicimonas sp.]|nr:glycosyltransferase [Propionicimonas sp.]